MLLYNGVDAVYGISGVFVGLFQQFGPWGQGEKGSELMLPICCTCDWMLTGDTCWTGTQVCLA